MAVKRGRWVRNPFYSLEDERRAMEDRVWQGWTLRGGHEPFIWQEDEDDDKLQRSKPGPPPGLSDEQVEKAIGWLLERPDRYAKQDSICEDLNKLLGVNYEKSFWRKWAIGPARKRRAEKMHG
jgi:hypothetical protein